MPHSLALDAKVLAALDDLELIARIVVEGFLEGLHQSPNYGSSTEFAAYRPYVAGDDIRRIDWKAWGRTDRFYVKQFEDETHLRANILLDASGSMGFGEGKEGEANKFDYGRMLSAVLVHLITRQHDSPGLTLFGNGPMRHLPPAGGLVHEDQLLQELARAEAAGSGEIDGTLRQMLDGSARKGMLIYISDFYAAADDPAKFVREMPGQQNEIIVFHLFAPEELDFSYEGNLLVEDMETGEKLTLNAEAVRQDYNAAVAKFYGEFEQACLQQGLDYHRISTGDPLDVALHAYCAKRMAIE